MGEYSSAQYLTQRFIKSLPKSYLINSFMEERTNQMSYKDVVQTALSPSEAKKPYNPHEFWRTQENKLHFELVRKDIILGILP